MYNIPTDDAPAHRIPTDLLKALTSDPYALTKWNSLTPLARNEWICWVTYVKSEDTRKEHITRAISELNEGMRRPCCWIGCIHRKDKSISPSIQGILNKKNTITEAKVIRKAEKLSDWRGKTMSRISMLIKQADPEIVEDVKWRTASNPAGAFVWYKDGLITTGETYKKHLKLGFIKGHALKDFDPKGLINSYRAMIIHEGDEIDEKAFKSLIHAAVALNLKVKSESKSDRS